MLHGTTALALMSLEVSLLKSSQYSIFTLYFSSVSPALVANWKVTSAAGKRIAGSKRDVEVGGL
jgi:hypothetical protein